jgi:hypothetical protein
MSEFIVRRIATNSLYDAAFFISGGAAGTKSRGRETPAGAEIVTIRPKYEVKAFA